MTRNPFRGPRWAAASPSDRTRARAVRAGGVLRTCAAIVLLAALPARATRVDYTLFVQPRAKSVHVSATISGNRDATLTVALPVWVPGYYRRLDQATGVSNFTATVDGKTVAAAHPTPSTWSLPHAANEPVTVDYDVKAFEYGFNDGDPAQTLGQMGVSVDRSSAYVHPGIACVYVDGQTSAPSTLALKLPEGWDSAVPLPKSRSGVYEAPDYDTLADSPVQMGRFTRAPFRARGHAFEVIATGDCRVSPDVMTDICRRAALATIDLFQGWTPFETYQFHLHFPPRRTVGGGGLEHRSSCVIVLSSRLNDETFAAEASRVIFHEFFHVWNVKALHPEGLSPFDYQGEPATPSLWMAEGLTDYYAHILSVRGGVWKAEATLKAFEALVAQYEASTGRNRTSLTESSEGVWQAADNLSSGSGGTNYYTKGLLAAWLLDVRIRAATKNTKSLDDALRRMIDRYAVKNAGYPPDALRAAIREATGVDVDGGYEAYIHGKEDLPLASDLAPLGVRFERLKVADTMLGAELEAGGRDATVKGLVRGSAAEAAGLRVGDVLLTIDGQPPRLGKGPLLGGAERQIGDRVPVVVRRDDEDVTLTVTVGSREQPRLTRVDSPTPAQQAMWDSLWKG